MKDIYVRTVRPTLDDAAACSKALADKSDINLLDPAVLSYPSTVVLVAEADQKPKLYMPVQNTYMLESLGAVEGATEREIALSLKNLLAIVTWEARKAGMGEVYFACTHQPTQEFALRHGFERLNIPVFRMRLGL